jgi:hypothetical protein
VTKNFLGIPVDDDISRNDRVAQRSLEDLAPLLRAVLDADMIELFGWTQYTPYFNDGDTCVFRVHKPWFRTVHDPDPELADDCDFYDLTLDQHPTLALTRWDSVARRMMKIERDAATTHVSEVCRAFSDALTSGAFDDVLLNAFGDHANVRVRRGGITVQSYEHD